jgi:hypothetical protein
MPMNILMAELTSLNTDNIESDSDDCEDHSVNTDQATVELKNSQYSFLSFQDISCSFFGQLLLLFRLIRVILSINVQQSENAENLFQLSQLNPVNVRHSRPLRLDVYNVKTLQRGSTMQFSGSAG